MFDMLSIERNLIRDKAEIYDKKSKKTVNMSQFTVD